METATLAGGCFWCTEAIFKRLKGVERVVSGYAGGDIQNPSYEQVSEGNTNHAEAVQITFNPSITSYEQILKVFWHLVDPTTLNQQGADVGTQYRSAIFYHSKKQQKTAQNTKAKVENERLYGEKPIVTQITPFTNFFPAEQYHQNYFEKNANQPYCRLIINPKIEKLINEFAEKIK